MSELVSPPSGAAAPDHAVTDDPATDHPAPGSTGSVVPEQVRPDDVATVRVPPPVGTLLAGRYQLRTRIGSDSAAGAEFWRAEDTVLRRDVAITVLRRLSPEDGALGGAEDPTGDARASEMVVRALRSGSFDHGGCARLLDVLGAGAPGMPTGVLGAAVTEWVPGRSLAEIVAEGLLKPLAVARAIAPLAAAAEEAHRHGLVLGCDHPHRVRITSEGSAQLCFALPRPDVTPADDVRGLGAVLYTMLTAQWPLSSADAARAGLAGTDGALLPPSEVRPGVPVELDTLAMGALGPPEQAGHVHTAAAVHRLLSEVVTQGEEATLFPPVHDGVPAGPGDIWQERKRGRAAPDKFRRRKLVTGIAVLSVLVLFVLGFIGVQVASLFSDGGTPVIVVSNQPVGPAGQAPADGPGAAGRAATVATAEVYNPTGDSDNPGRISRVIDGDNRTSWRTQEYWQQFPALKPGVGIMLSFASAVQLSQLTINSPSAGSVIEVRSAPTADAALTDTQPITTTTLQNGVTTVSLAESQPVSHVLLWITKLGSSDGKNLTEINEVRFERAGS
ncbi:protein kinase family protein [Pseudonocardia sp. GCM10023141]|uniref:protein kinase family protein n=1 Tax=Pseudonocardia sp. GCM10023141 TaxID=3252653 RepID=UPI003607BA52